MMDTAITVNSILTVLGAFVAVGAFVTVCVTLYKYMADAHDRAQKWDDYDKKISEVNEAVEESHTDMDAKIQEIRAEQCMLTYCMMATLDGLHQLGCNGKVTQAREDLDKYMNKSAHGVSK